MEAELRGIEEDRAAFEKECFDLKMMRSKREEYSRQEYLANQEVIDGL